MSKVLKADGSAATASVETDLGSDQAEVWASYGLYFDSAALALWNGGSSGHFLQLWDAPHAAVQDSLLISGSQWVDALSAGGTPAAGAWVNLESHYLLDDGGGNSVLELYVAGVLVLTGTFPTVADSPVRFAEFGNDNGPADAANVVYVRNVKVGTTRGAQDLFHDDFASGDLSAWTSTSGDVSVVEDPLAVGLAVATAKGLVPGDFTTRRTVS